MASFFAALISRKRDALPDVVTGIDRSRNGVDSHPGMPGAECEQQARSRDDVQVIRNLTPTIKTTTIVAKSQPGNR